MIVELTKEVKYRECILCIGLWQQCPVCDCRLLQQRSKRITLSLNV